MYAFHNNLDKILDALEIELLKPIFTSNKKQFSNEDYLEEDLSWDLLFEETREYE